MSVIYSAYVGGNSELIKNVVELYFSKGDKIADVTFGKGVFWKSVNLTDFDVAGTDLKNGTDFRNLPYGDNQFDHSVIDPPYARITNLKGMANSYNTSRYVTHDDIINLYSEGLKELKRVTKNKGYILCKCQDEIHAGKQRWSHIEILKIAEEYGMYAKDLFVLVNKMKPKPLYKQQHARKTHSYLWVFQVNKSFSNV